MMLELLKHQISANTIIKCNIKRVQFLNMQDSSKIIHIYIDSVGSMIIL